LSRPKAVSKYEGRKSTPPVVDQQLVTFSCFAKEKVTKKKATPVSRPYGVPCVAQGKKEETKKHRVDASCPIVTMQSAKGSFRVGYYKAQRVAMCHKRNFDMIFRPTHCTMHSGQKGIDHEIR